MFTVAPNTLYKTKTPFKLVTKNLACVVNQDTIQ